MRKFKLGVTIASLTVAATLGVGLTAPQPAAAESCFWCWSWQDENTMAYLHEDGWMAGLGVSVQGGTMHTNPKIMRCSDWHSSYNLGGDGDGDGDCDPCN